MKNQFANKTYLSKSQSNTLQVDLEQYYITPEVIKLINIDLAKKHILIPIEKRDDTIFIAMEDPLNILAINDIKIATGLEAKPVLASRKSILNAIERYYSQHDTQKAIEDFRRQYANKKTTELNPNEPISDIDNAPIVRLLDSIIGQAVNTKSSDIHIEPFENRIRIRFRIDGELQEVLSLEVDIYSAIITRIKIMGKLDISEKRIPQDGRIETSIYGKKINLRISTLPTIYGEKIAIRLFDPENFLIPKEELGFSHENLTIFNNLIRSPSGIILITGPTSSGKTTTLYAILQELNDKGKNIITIEDPVEYRLEGINQVQVNPKTKLTFANVLRSILRQDPNIIMIGEIRDAETANIAIRAAITGHLVLSTIHTKDPPSTIFRLIDMGVEPYLLSPAILGIISQRLVRKICPNCKKKYKPDMVEKKLLNIIEDCYLYKGMGCNYCNGTGYKGRTAIQEILTVTKDIRTSIIQNDSLDQLRQKSISQGMIPLKKSCMNLVVSGITTMEEMLKVTYIIE